MVAIVAVDSNWGIGRQGKLLVSIPADMKRFREMTTGKVVVLGRKTLETFPQGRPLPNRTNIILSRKQDYEVKDAVIVHDLDELQAEIQKYDSADVCIIGGEQIYRMMLPYCDVCEVTHLDRAYESDAHFPNLDEDPEWELTDESEEQSCFDTTYTFRKYVRKNN